MTTFQDGPAAGKHLSLHRAAMFLRVVEENGKFDALDQLDDTPKPTEKIYAYTIVGKPGMCHVNRGGGRGGFYALATYRLCTKQPPDDVMRDSAAWEAWVRSQIEA